MASKPIDWSQLWYPGPRRAFTADEMARAGSDRPSPTLLMMSGANMALMAFVFLQMAPPRETARLLAVMVPLLLGAAAVAQWLWWRPWRGPLMVATLAWLLLTVTTALLLRWGFPDREERHWMAILVGSTCSLMAVLQWFLVIWRAQQIEARLAQQAEREKAIEMARRLAAAQLEPHFLFNTLASVQHWVQTKDDRAAPLLAALTGYLRATLPLFNRPLLAVGDELAAVERYLQVMQARMGARLDWSLEVEPALRSLTLPPGVLLTLVENAVVHGLEPQLGGGTLRLRGRRQGPGARFEVTDDGPGPSPALQEGVGLANLRHRLALTCGDNVRLSLGAAPGGGFRALLDVLAVPPGLAPPPRPGPPATPREKP